MGTSATQSVWTGKRAEYKVPKGQDVPEVLHGRKLTTRESANLEEFRQLVENGADESIHRLAQGAWDIIDQRKMRDYLESEEVASILAGKVIKEADGSESDFGDLSDEDRITEVLSRAQEIGDSYIHGPRSQSVGGGKAVKEKAGKFDAVAAAAANDPELAAKLASLGFTI